MTMRKFIKMFESKAQAAGSEEPDRVRLEYSQFKDEAIKNFRLVKKNNKMPLEIVSRLKQFEEAAKTLGAEQLKCDGDEGEAQEYFDEAYKSLMSVLKEAYASK